MRPEIPYRIFIGHDVNETVAANVARESLLSHTDPSAVDIDRICRLSLWRQYRRPTTRMPSGQLFDELSGAPMSTDHAIARFFVPYLCGYEGWALFLDGDVLVREDIRKLFALANDDYAVQVVQHPPQLEERDKKGGQIQQAYPRKNWSSVMLFHCGHPANQRLTLDVLNTWPGRDLHGFTWLDDDQIGRLPARWNYLVHVHDFDPTPALVHYTLGVPDMEGHAGDPFAPEWFGIKHALGYETKEDVRDTATKS